MKLHETFRFYASMSIKGNFVNFFNNNNSNINKQQ